jgi:holo-[acyl-carrier protein] synthase
MNYESVSMNIICHGIDLVDCKRIDELVERHGDRFLKRVFTEAERAYSNRHRYRTERLGGRFAVKEAVMKMIGVGWQEGASWTDIETRNNALGKPEVHLAGRIAELAGQMGIEQISVSITHTSGMAIASAIALGTSDSPGNCTDEHPG